MSEDDRLTAAAKMQSISRGSSKAYTYSKKKP